MVVIIAAQMVMIGVAATVGWALRRGTGRKTIFLVAFVTLPIGGILFTLTDSPLGVVAIQLLDGVAAGIFGLISIIIAADLMRGTGRFNLAQVWLPYRPAWAQERATFSVGLSSKFSDTLQVFLLWPRLPPADFSFLPRLCPKRSQRIVVTRFGAHATHSAGTGSR